MCQMVTSAVESVQAGRKKGDMEAGKGLQCSSGQVCVFTCEPEGGMERAKWALGKEGVSRERPAKP